MLTKFNVLSSLYLSIYLSIHLFIYLYLFILIFSNALNCKSMVWSKCILLALNLVQKRRCSWLIWHIIPYPLMYWVVKIIEIVTLASVQLLSLYHKGMQNGSLQKGWTDRFVRAGFGEQGFYGGWWQ